MAIVTETITINDKQFIRTYSDAGFMIHGGSPEGDYAEACDPAELNRIYIETNIPIEGDSSTVEDEYSQAGRILMGVEE